MTDPVSEGFHLPQTVTPDRRRRVTDQKRDATWSTSLSRVTSGTAQVRPKANIYIDGLNMYYGCLKGTSYKWLDLAVLCGKLVPSHSINRIRYFTARISARPGGDLDSPVRQETYLRALATTPRLSIHLGHFQQTVGRAVLANPIPGGPKTVAVLKTEEKGGDVNLATYLLLDAFRKDCNLAVVVTNDSDLEEPIRVVIQELGVPVGIVNPHPARRRSRSLNTLNPLFFKQIKPNALRACQFPAALTDVNGTFHRPAKW
jgi:NYN domain